MTVRRKVAWVLLISVVVIDVAAILTCLYRDFILGIGTVADDGVQMVCLGILLFSLPAVVNITRLGKETTA